MEALCLISLRQGQKHMLPLPLSFSFLVALDIRKIQMIQVSKKKKIKVLHELQSVNVLVHVFPVFAPWADICIDFQKKKTWEIESFLYVECSEQYLAHSERLINVMLLLLLPFYSLIFSF